MTDAAPRLDEDSLLGQPALVLMAKLGLRTAGGSGATFAYAGASVFAAEA